MRTVLSLRSLCLLDLPSSSRRRTVDSEVVITNILSESILSNFIEVSFGRRGAISKEEQEILVFPCDEG